MTSKSRHGALSVLSGHTFVYLSGTLAARLASFLLLPLFTPLLLKSDYGLLELTDTTITLLLQLVGFQLDAALSRRYLAATDDAGRRRVVGTASVALTALSVAIAAVLLVFAGPISAVLLDDAAHAPLVRWMAAILVTMVVAEVPLAVLKAERRSVAATVWQLLRLVAELGLKIGLVVGAGLGALGVLEGQGIAGLAFLACVLVWQTARYGVSFDRAELKAMIAYSAPMVAAGLCQFALHSSSRYLFRAFSTLDELGMYGIGFKFGYAPTAVVLSAFLLVWYPFVFGIKDEGERRRLLSQASLFVPALLVLVSLPVALFAPEILALFTDPQYHSAWPLVPPLLFAYLFWGLYQIVQTPFYVAYRTDRSPRVVLIAAVGNVAATIALLPALGAMGAALATIASMALLTVVARAASRRIEPYPIDWARLLTLAVPCAAAAAALYIVPVGSNVSLVVRAATALLACGWLAFFFVRKDERDRMAALLTRRSEPVS